jgi:tetratricopeptide (TPR) repeat protein
MNELKATFPRINSNQLSLFSSEEIPLPNSPYAMGLLMDEKGSLQEAKTYYLRAIQEEDHVPEAYCNIGVIESRMDRSTHALTAFARALAIRPLFVDARHNMALEYLDQEDYLLAGLHIEIALQLDPEAPGLHFCQALVCIGKDDFTEALEGLRKFQEIAPDEKRDEIKQLEELIQAKLKSHESTQSTTKRGIAG